MSLLLTRVEVLTSASRVVSCRLVSCRSFWLSGHLFLAMQFISVYLFQREVERTDPASQNQNFLLLQMKRAYARARDRNTARANQSSFQDCRLATNQRLKKADLRHRLKQNQKIKTNRNHFKTWPPP